MTPLSEAEVEASLARVPSWTLSEDGKTIARDWTFRDFKEAMGFVQKVAAISNAEDHHPDIQISYNKVGLELSTHDAGGLTEKDFIVAAQVDAL